LTQTIDYQHSIQPITSPHSVSTDNWI